MQQEPSSGEQSGFPRGLRGADLREKRFRDRVRHEYRDLRASMLSDDQHARLSRSRPPLRWIKEVWWLFKGLVTFLTPTRRVLLLVGLILASLRISIQSKHLNTDQSFSTAGLILVLFVLMLELKDKLVARNELQDGHAVQRALMPERSPHVPGWKLWLFTRAANDVGGDLVDFARLEGGASVLTLGDVSGKGLKAALLTAKLQATLRALLTERLSQVELLARVNAVFRRDALPQVFASLVSAVIEPAGGTVRIVNAGHLPPLVIRQDAVLQLEKGGPALGLMDRAEFREQSVDLGPGEILLIYSDGLIETQNGAGEFFGEERLRTLVAGSCASGAADLGDRLVASCDGFQGYAPAHDDLSLVILQRA
ncbi:MAG TPA: PP2C family protein-serine/threonine phosphatase [Bacteroidota bacterium]|nr:PP2C family protein-serine/threonine phosphatase [Bacteroidota bacterium]